MDKLKTKLDSLRTEADVALQRAEHAESAVKQVEQQLANKGSTDVSDFKRDFS